MVRNMRQHRQNTEVQKQGWFALGILAKNEEDSIKVILEAMRQHSGHEEVQLWGLRALLANLTGSKATKRR